MAFSINATGAAPPLRLSWRSDTGLLSAVPGENAIYGVTATGQHVVALSTADGTQRWASSGAYVPGKVSRQGNRLFAYRVGEGLTYLDDLSTSVTERLAMSFGATADTALSAPATDQRMVYVAVNQGLYAIHQDIGLQYAAVLGNVTPHTVKVVAPGEVVVINGRGVPMRLRAGQTEFETVWTGQEHGVNTLIMEHPAVVTGSLLIIGVEPDTVAYNLATGRIVWHIPNVPAQAFALEGDTVFAGFFGATMWAIRASSGQVLWQRQYFYSSVAPRDHSVAVVGNSVYYGCLLKGHPDPGLLMAVDAAEGTFQWLSRAIVGSWGGGLPLSVGDRVIAYGTPATAAYEPLATAPNVNPDLLQVTPRPLRGTAAQFGEGKVQVEMPVAARVSIAAYRERTGLATPVLRQVNWSAGHHEVTWTPAGTNGFTDDNQFGYMLFDIEETSGAKYTQAVLLPVNTFPDVVWHWSRTSVEIMVYNRFLSGYPDQLFRPDNQVTRAESCAIIAKTLGLNGPTPAFQTAFTDIGQHWARNSIMALEERRIIGGFAEPDGTFTFRPDLNMTRGQEARILVRAYEIPAAPDGFQTNFTDVAGHWARADIEALEASGYVRGFLEADGTYTYRPEQNLSRAEICTLIVRIRELHR